MSEKVVNSKRKERLNEPAKVMNCGLKAKIIKYNGSKDIDVEFEDGFIAKNMEYGQYVNGQIKSGFIKNKYGGYLGYAKATQGASKNKLSYERWIRMLQRCNDEKILLKRPTYKDCKVCDDWLCFEVFEKWWNTNYYNCSGETMCLDKDILIKGNKLYSESTCLIVPERINCLFINKLADRGEYPIGVSYDKPNKLYRATCSTESNKAGYLGLYKSIDEAFEMYKETKEKYINKVADDYKDKIPTNVYNAMVNYKIEITD